MEQEYKHTKKKEINIRITTIFSFKKRSATQDMFKSIYAYNAYTYALIWKNLHTLHNYIA